MFEVGTSSKYREPFNHNSYLPMPLLSVDLVQIKSGVLSVTKELLSGLIRIGVVGRSELTTLAVNPTDLVTGLVIAQTEGLTTIDRQKNAINRDSFGTSSSYPLGRQI